MQDDRYWKLRRILFFAVNEAGFYGDWLTLIVNSDDFERCSDDFERYPGIQDDLERYSGSL